jgi:hypothetical protein
MKEPVVQIVPMLCLAKIKITSQEREDHRRKRKRRNIISAEYQNGITKYQKEGESEIWIYEALLVRIMIDGRNNNHCADDRYVPLDFIKDREQEWQKEERITPKLYMRENFLRIHIKYSLISIF